MALLEIKNLSKSFGDLQVLKDINIQVEKGEVIVIIGPSGSGKSTMLRCCNLLEKPTGGQIIYKGEDITGLGKKVKNYRKSVGMDFQRYNLFVNKIRLFFQIIHIPIFGYALLNYYLGISTLEINFACTIILRFVSEVHVCNVIIVSSTPTV